MRTKQLLVLSLLLFCFGSSGTLKAQDSSRSCYLPIWTFHQRNIDIYGISLGLASYGLIGNPMRTNTNGIKAELIGSGMFIPLFPTTFYPPAENDSIYNEFASKHVSEIINGLYISATGTICHCLTNGIVASGIGQTVFQVNGLAVSPYNSAQRINGVQIGLFNGVHKISGFQIGFTNGSVRARAAQIGLINVNLQEASGAQLSLIMNRGKNFCGIQIGLYNNTENLTGLQIGIWNINQDRSSPIINWSF